MAINRFFKSNKIKEHLVFQQNGNIWRFYLHGNFLVGETREHKTRNAYLFSMDFVKEEIFLKNFQIEEKWWFSISGITGDIICISKFRKPDLPEQQGIIVLDIKSGKKLWENTMLTLLFSNATDTYAYKKLFESKIYYRLDTSNGNIISETKAEDEVAHIYSLKEQFETINYKTYSYTERYLPGITHAGDEVDLYFGDYLKDVKLTGPIEFIIKNNLLIYNYHKEIGANLKTLNENLTDNIFNIYDLKKGKLLYSTILNKNTAGYAPDSFFINNNYLFFIRNKKELIIINLEQW
jgi:hypothetical protein